MLSVCCPQEYVHWNFRNFEHLLWHCAWPGLPHFLLRVKKNWFSFTSATTSGRLRTFKLHMKGLSFIWHSECGPVSAHSSLKTFKQHLQNDPVLFLVKSWATAPVVNDDYHPTWAVILWGGKKKRFNSLHRGTGQNNCKRAHRTGIISQESRIQMIFCHLQVFCFLVVNPLLN